MATAPTDTALLQREIADAREHLGRSLYLVGDLIAPKKVIARTKAKIGPVRLLHRGRPALPPRSTPL